ncbi:double-strand break repair helicase AddA [Phyllobacterium endophyticum]|uniref:DNA 3'-5' helicase n=1 Tax=Phyllobacterium endophyticum TaxID=1149773 RepID=A0A2P7AZ96_9HYPH|nr:double-strand break repair helicase AddA [Phyllobacterium endophyticum]MBB3235882.1 ATP-dependent helicase/nuclease subunit A [Phyllobacterium endophyticum]PSH59528.1 double-strand break repair helicase AddA [Phyllobacterium endophyticum]TYR41666.1 double-strand break repair helicase AddA [Phyllobacterium endophyticum]
MKQPRIIPRETIANQNKAADPRDSVWVSANAGSGKTHVLTERVIRLLLDGTDPSKILCLTYTKAAAAVMQNRVFSRLSEWATMNDEALAKTIEDIDRKVPGQGRLAEARRLFARALETPGGLKIQTIHAFCEAILHQFPLEANIAGHFELMDDMMQVALVGEARRQLLQAARLDQNAQLAAAFADVLDAAGEFGLQQLLDEAVNKRHDLIRFIAEIGHDGLRRQAFYSHFGFSCSETEDSILATLWPVRGFDEPTLSAMLSIEKGAVKAQEFALVLLHARFNEDIDQREEALRTAFLKAGGEPRSASVLATKAVLEHFPDFVDLYEQAAQDVFQGLDRLKQLRLIRLTLSALALVDDLIARYQQMKRTHGLLDFDDLIIRTVNLLARQDAGPWVQYKLDKGIDHILVDEAQDTSPNQWRVIRLLSEEFFSGRSARDTRRTLFAVGDEKQSIYSFQGAIPEDFAAHGRATARNAEQAELSFSRVNLNFSFRSTPDVLSAVDKVFERPEAHRGFGGNGPTVHTAIRDHDPGEVQIWDMLTPETTPEEDDWRKPVDSLPAPPVRLAEQIASTIDHWLKNGEIIEGKSRRLEARDIMVLVRKRDQFMPALSRELKKRHVPVAGADRLKLTDHIAIKDLIALGRFMLLPSDDLSLAALLKSPLFKWDDEQLFDLAHGRAEYETLYHRLKARAEDDLILRATAQRLQTWRNRADTVPVFEFYAEILGPGGARRDLLARLGHEAGDVIDEFQNYAVATEKTGLPGLQAFLETLDAATPEIKRELDQSRNEVRIMTVHAAKGLEAAVVFLIDSGSAASSGGRMPNLLSFDMKEKDGWEGQGFLFVPAKAYATEFTRRIIDGLKIRSEEEYRRLLYVGMTRAEDRLIVCGYRGLRQPPDTWQGLVDAALGELSEPFRHPVESVVARRYRVTERISIPVDEPVAIENKLSRPFPAAYRTPMPREAGLPRPLAPSGVSVLIEPENEAPLVTGSPVLTADGSDPSFAIRRGTIIHALLQMLPNLPDGQRLPAAERYMSRAAFDWPAPEIEAAVQSVLRVMNDQRFAPVFAAGSLSEIAVMGTLHLRGKDHAVSGVIDRLAVNESRVLIVDYKTNRPAPLALDSVPAAYVAQLGLYRRLLEPLYPGKAVEAALLYTEGPHLIDIPPDAMQDALTRLG